MQPRNDVHAQHAGAPRFDAQHIHTGHQGTATRCTHSYVNRYVRVHAFKKLLAGTHTHAGIQSQVCPVITSLDPSKEQEDTGTYSRLTHPPAEDM